MARRKTMFLVLTWVLSLLTVGLWAQIGSGGIMDSQTGKIIRPGQPFGPIITAPNIGFPEVAGGPERAGTIHGRWMVRVNGEWLTVVTPATARAAN